jgi:hypothetical protein
MPDQNTSGEEYSRFRVPVAAAAVIVALSLLTWGFFYMEAMQLDKGATVIVTGVWTGVVLGIRWMWTRTFTHKTSEKK